MELNNEDLYKTHDKMKELRKETYEKIYKRCINTIKAASKLGELICIYEIPNFVFGSSLPIINIELCSKYIIKKLSTNKNIKALFIEPNLIFIDWRKKII